MGKSNTQIVNLQPGLKATVLTFSVEKTQVVPLEENVLTAYLTDVDGNPLPGRQWVNGFYTNPAGETWTFGAMTDIGGGYYEYKFTFAENAPIGNYDFWAEFTGDSVYEGC